MRIGNEEYTDSEIVDACDYIRPFTVWRDVMQYISEELPFTMEIYEGTLYEKQFPSDGIRVRTQIKENAKVILPPSTCHCLVLTSANEVTTFTLDMRYLDSSKITDCTVYVSGMPDIVVNVLLDYDKILHIRHSLGKRIFVNTPDCTRYVLDTDLYNTYIMATREELTNRQITTIKGKDDYRYSWYIQDMSGSIDLSELAPIFRYNTENCIEILLKNVIDINGIEELVSTEVKAQWVVITLCGDNVEDLMYDLAKKYCENRDNGAMYEEVFTLYVEVDEFKDSATMYELFDSKDDYVYNDMVITTQIGKGRTHYLRLGFNRRV